MFGSTTTLLSHTFSLVLSRRRRGRSCDVRLPSFCYLWKSNSSSFPPHPPKTATDSSAHMFSPACTSSL
ncbi:hypothetical protein E2C01_064470 [Portunus trituberculatus]|uniref:Uncharacterized protein n=1 Tax=Portunus trituberculatus TaxID=210409 RepID=A0A5B7HNB2_PORTR|nr:hypothetical protein [Portunus trituberculatus]